MRFGDERQSEQNTYTTPSKYFSLPFGPEERRREVAALDQQHANSAVSQIVSFEKKINGQVPQASSHFFTIDSSPKPFYQSQNIHHFPSSTVSPVHHLPVIQSAYPQSLINNSPLTSELRILNTINVNTTPLPKILPSITQTFYENHQDHQDLRQQQTQYSGFRSRSDNRNFQREHHHSHSSQNNEESVVVKVVPAYGFYLNDPKEREAYFEAVSRGLLDDNGYIYVNNVQQNPDSSIPITTTYQQKASNILNLSSRPHGSSSTRSDSFFSSNNDNRFHVESNAQSFPRENHHHHHQNSFSNGDIVPTMITTHYTQHSGNNFGKNMYANNYNHQSQQLHNSHNSNPNSNNNNNLFAQRQTNFHSPQQNQHQNFNQNHFRYDERPSSSSSIFTGYSSYNAPQNSVGRLENDSDSVSSNVFRNRNHPSIRFRNKRKLDQEGSLAEATSSSSEAKSKEEAEKVEKVKENQPEKS